MLCPPSVIPRNDVNGGRVGRNVLVHLPALIPLVADDVGLRGGGSRGRKRRRCGQDDRGLKRIRFPREHDFFIYIRDLALTLKLPTESLVPSRIGEVGRIPRYLHRQIHSLDEKALASSP